MFEFLGDIGTTALMAAMFGTYIALVANAIRRQAKKDKEDVK